MMKKLTQPFIANFLFKARLPKLLLFTSLLLLFNQCGDDSLKADDPLEDQQLIKIVYQVKGLDDSFFKEYAAYTYFDIDTTSYGDTLSILHTSRFEDNDKLDLTIFIEEAFQLKVYEENIGSSKYDFMRDIWFDNIFCVIDSGYFQVKAFDGSTMSASIDVIASAIKGKRYHITSEDIIATPKGYIIPE